MKFRRHTKLIRSPLPLPQPGLLPNNRWLAVITRALKTVEVLVFKVLQFFDLYRPQKSIIGIPSLATSKFALIQAAVFNGTQEEVLGYRPRRLLHRLLKGLPDVEMFERVRFKIALPDQPMRTVELGTELKGFIHHPLQWDIRNLPKMAWLRMRAAGVATTVGNLQLGDYEVISSPVFFLNEEVKWVIISDIDDTIKDSHVALTTARREILRSLFQGHYYKYEAIPGMAELYQELAAKGALIVYVTSTPYQLAPFILKFLRQANFPDGPIFLRWLGYNRFGHKIRALTRVLNHVKHHRCILVGDSGEQDLQIYRRICEVAQYGDHVEKILIRHVPGTPLPKVKHQREHSYKSVDQLREKLDFILSS